LVDLLRKIEDGSITAATSELTLAEALVRPIAEGKEAVIRAYTEAITSREHFFVLPIDRPVLFKAATLRAGSGMRLPDAIHVASAQLAGMNVFLTNDRGIRLPRHLELRLLSASDAPPPAG
jgi:predicted nucleic acid-binding protein